MPIVALHGHKTLRARLLESLERGTLPQSLLLHGAAGIGKQRLALWLAAALVCDQDKRPCGACRHCRMVLDLQHPDVLWVFPRPRLKESDAAPDEVRGDLIEANVERAGSKGLYAAPSGTDGIFVHTMRMVVKGASMKPAMARRQVVIIGDADRMVSQEGADQAANAFLKLLEEPPPHTFLILTTSAPGALLPTIRSRVIAVRVAPLGDDDMRAWLADQVVQEALRKENLPSSMEERLALAAGAPGRLLGAHEAESAFNIARRFLRVSEAGDTEGAVKLALSQGGSGARGRFTDMLEALETELQRSMRDAATAGHEARARGVAKAVEALEDAKAQAQGNVNPQLVAWSLLGTLRGALSAGRPG